MYSVTGRIAKTKQPYGGFIKRTDFTVVQLDDNTVLHETENLHPALIGLAVDYLTRYLMGTPVKQAFRISCIGAHLAKEDENADELMRHISGLTKNSISAACKLSGYDACNRAGMSGYKPVSEINPDNNTIDNIAIMVKRSVDFWNTYGPVVLDGFTFEGGYSPVVSTGDGDYLTKDTLWDYKVSKNEPNSNHTLQLLVYYIMGMHSIHKEFSSIEYLGLFNPRKNKVYRYPVKAISSDIIETVSHDVIGYGWTEEEYKAFYQKELGASAQLLLKKGKSDSLLKNESFEKGDMVFHQAFGRGRILSIKNAGKTEIAEVQFDSNQKKLIITSYLSHSS